MTYDWAGQMQQHSDFFRGVLADEGVDYLVFDGGMLEEGAGGFEASEEEINAKLQEIDTRIRLDFIEFSSGRIEDTRAIMTKLENADLEILRDYSEHINDTKDRLTFWTGDAATNFNDYLNAFEGAMEWNRNCIWATWRAMNAYLELQKAFRARILDLVQATQDALDVVEAEEEARSQRMQIAIVSAVVAVGAAAAAIPSAGASAAALGAAYAGVGGALIAGGGATASIQVGGGHKGEVICNRRALPVSPSRPRGGVDQGPAQQVDPIAANHLEPQAQRGPRGPRPARGRSTIDAPEVDVDNHDTDPVGPAASQSQSTWDNVAMLSLPALLPPV
jgi:hypothetical protein